MSALQKVRPIERLIVLNIPHPALFLKRVMTWPQILRSWYIFFFQIPRLPELVLGMRRAKGIAEMIYNTAVDKSRFPDEVLEVYRENACQPGALTAMLNYYRANCRHFFRGLTPDQKLAIGSTLEIPTLMIWGEEDVALGKELTYGTEKLVTNLTIRYLPGVSHWVQQEAPEIVSAMIEAWLSNKEVPKAGPDRRLISVAKPG